MSDEKTLNGWSAQELRDLANAAPSWVGRLEDGAIVPHISRDEFASLRARYPSMDVCNGKPLQAAYSEAAGEAAERERNAELARRYPGPKGTCEAGADATLRARYPSMFPQR